MNTLARQLSDSSIARWFRTLSKREQVLVYVALILVGIVLSFVLLSSVQNFRNDIVEEYQQKLGDLDWMKANVEQAKLKAAMSGARDQEDWRPIYRIASLHNIDIKRIEPGSNGAAIDLEPQAFQDVLNWIFALQEDAGMRIAEVRLTEVDLGMVNTNLVIQ